MLDDGVNGFGGGKVLGVDDQIRIVRGQIVRIDADQGIDLSVPVIGSWEKSGHSLNCEIQ